MAAEEAIALSPNDPSLKAFMGHYIAFAGEWDRGVTMIEGAMRLDPLAHPSRYFVIGHNHVRKGEYEKALAAYTKINQPDCFVIWRSLAVTYARLGRMDQAKAAADKLLELYPSYEAEVWIYLRDWNFTEDFVSTTIDGLRLAGLNIADEPASVD